MKLLDDLCYGDVLDSRGKEVRDGERVTQGLGAVWGLILGRPNNRQACLDIALKVTRSCKVNKADYGLYMLIYVYMDHSLLSQSCSFLSYIAIYHIWTLILLSKAYN